jgi:hypothetical protein
MLEEIGEGKGNVSTVYTDSRDQYHLFACNPWLQISMHSDDALSPKTA